MLSPSQASQPSHPNEIISLLFDEEHLSPSQFEATRLAFRVEAARLLAANKNILRWGFHLFPEKFKLPFCQELHEYFVSIRNDDFTDTEAPRNHAKTTIKCFLIPIFQALEEPEAYDHYLNVQATNAKALAVNVAIKHELEYNEGLRRLYKFRQGARWTDQQFVVEVQGKNDKWHEIVFTCVSAGQSIRGLHYKHKRPKYILVDDLYDEEDINNPDSTIKKNDWFWSTLYPARAKGSKCSVHVQGTAINPEDLLESLKKKEGVCCRSFKAMNEETRQVLWPELNTYESLMADREKMGSVIFYREMQNERRDETSAIVKRSWLADWEYDPKKVFPIDDQHTLVGVVLGADPSIGEKNENDFTGLALVYKVQAIDALSGCKYYIHGLWNEHISLNERIRLCNNIQEGQPKGFKITQANIEAIAGFKDFCAELRRRTSLPVHEVDKVPDKISNLENKSHYFENKKVFINKDIDPKLKDILVHQLTTNHPKHDDLRDGVLLCLDDQGGLWNFV